MTVARGGDSRRTREWGRVGLLGFAGNKLVGMGPLGWFVLVRSSWFGLGKKILLGNSSTN